MLRDYQARLVQEIYQAWEAGHSNVMATAPTGAGKTVIVSHIINELRVPTVAIAHRTELVSQLALTLNREGVRHSIIAPDAIARQVMSAEHTLHGVSHYDPRAKTRVASVNSLVSAARAREAWYESIQLVIIDEGHHVTKESNWDKALRLFPRAHALLVTAHALRGDRLGLGRHSDGVVDYLVIGPSCRDLINRGMLCDFRLFCPPTDLRLNEIAVDKTGDYNSAQVRDAVHKSAKIVGDVVDTYHRLAAGKLGLTFAVDIAAANELAAAYQKTGVPCEVIVAETPLLVRANIMRRFRERKILQLISVDVLSEGVDVPGVEVVSMARPTLSFQVYSQQIGRALRVNVDPAHAARWGEYTDDERKALIVASGKPKALIIDHVDNVIQNGLPDSRKFYTLDRPEKKRRKSSPPGLITCLSCFQPYERILDTCPHCQTPKPAPESNKKPEQVEGDVIELDPETLAAMRAEIERIDAAPRIPAKAKHGARLRIIHLHMERQQAQQGLRKQIALYGGYMVGQGLSVREVQRAFYHNFGVDVLTAQTLSKQDANELESVIDRWLNELNIKEQTT